MVVKSPEGAEGAARLHAYWVAGEGLAKWRTKPHPWTTLRRHLAKYIQDPQKLDATTSKWFAEVFGHSAGSDLHRVESGKPPRGERIGPG
jgi:hypothetical protein